MDNQYRHLSVEERAEIMIERSKGVSPRSWPLSQNVLHLILETKLLLAAFIDLPIAVALQRSKRACDSHRSGTAASLCFR